MEVDGLASMREIDGILVRPSRLVILPPRLLVSPEKAMDSNTHRFWIEHRRVKRGVSAALPLILGLYILVVYPIIPQPWGGGKPMDAVLIVEADKLPAELPQLGTLFDAPIEQAEIPRAGRLTAGLAPSRSEQSARATATLRLRFQSEHAYLVQRKNGPVVSISKEVVSAVLFQR
jgi:hypothetical protein